MPYYYCGDFTKKPAVRQGQTYETDHALLSFSSQTRNTYQPGTKQPPMQNSVALNAVRLVVRTTKNGKLAGREFWGMRRFRIARDQSHTELIEVSNITSALRSTDTERRLPLLQGNRGRGNSMEIPEDRMKRRRWAHFVLFIKNGATA
jgi:hypothetical protein